MSMSGFRGGRGGAPRFGLGFVSGGGEGIMITFPVWAWFAFAGFVLLLLALDLFVLHRGEKEISFREAAVLRAASGSRWRSFSVSSCSCGPGRPPPGSTTPATS
jgi:hypothetical protein